MRISFRNTFFNNVHEEMMKWKEKNISNLIFRKWIVIECNLFRVNLKKCWRPGAILMRYFPRNTRELKVILDLYNSSYHFRLILAIEKEFSQMTKWWYVKSSATLANYTKVSEIVHSGSDAKLMEIWKMCNPRSSSSLDS